MPSYYIYKDSDGEIVQTGFGDLDFIEGFESEGLSISIGHADLNRHVVQNGNLVMKSEELMLEIDRSQAMAELRHVRDILLSKSDWTQVADAPVDKAAWAAYRQALRDLPSNTEDPRNPIWPQQP